MFTSSTQALLWKCWQLSWRPLMVQQILTISCIWIVLGFFNTDDPIEVESVIAHIIVGFSLIFLLVTPTTIAKKEGTVAHITGFPFRHEFVLPISTKKLVFIPILYFALMFLFAYAVPLFVLNAILGIAGPQFIIALMAIELLLTIIALSWWSTNMLAHSAGWLIVLTLYWFEQPYSSFTFSEESYFVLTNSPFDFIIPTLLTTIYLTILFFGVRQQRRGENLLNLPKDTSFFGTIASYRGLPRSRKSPCPIDSPIKAEIWKENQIRGLSFTLILGAIIGVVALLLLRIIFLNSAENPLETKPEAIFAMSIGFYSLLFIMLHLNPFGASYHNGINKVSVFEKTIALSSARLAFIKLSANILRAVVAALAMTMTIWFIGPLFIENFSTVKTITTESIAAFLDQATTAIVLDLLGFLIGFATISVIWSAFTAWYMIKPKLMSLALPLLMLYGFVLTFITFLFSEGNEFNSLIETVLVRHLWIFILGFPITIVFLYRGVLREQLLQRLPFTGVAALGLVVWLTYLYSLNQRNFYTEVTRLEIVAANSLLGLLPLFAVGLALWTMSKIRHG